MKHRDCAELGIASRGEHLPATATLADVVAVVDDYNADPGVDAVLIQYPFPAGLDYEAALLRLDPAKDADGLHPVNLGRLVHGGRRRRSPAPPRASSPCSCTTTSPSPASTWSSSAAGSPSVARSPTCSR